MSASNSDFKNIRLPHLALADMYGSHLVAIGQPPGSKPTGSAAAPPSSAPAPVAQEVPPKPAPESTPAPPAPAQANPEPASCHYLGGFAQQVLIMVQQPDAPHIGEAQLSFLTRIIGAVGLSLNDVAIVNTHHQKVTYEALKKQLPARIALYFGLEPLEIGVPMRFPHYQVQPWDSCVFLYAPALEGLDGSSPEQTEHKKQLWAALKKIFS